jgi:hypothetical protein
VSTSLKVSDCGRWPLPVTAPSALSEIGRYKCTGPESTCSNPRASSESSDGSEFEYAPDRLAAPGEMAREPDLDVLSTEACLLAACVNDAVLMPAPGTLYILPNASSVSTELDENTLESTRKDGPWPDVRGNR